jgi:protein involved in polysaccharide export with SLBB domain
MKNTIILLLISALLLTALAGQAMAENEMSISERIIARRAQAEAQRSNDQPHAPDPIEPAPAPLVLPPEGPSDFELYVNGKMRGDVDTNLRQFGYELFDTSPSLRAPSGAASVVSGYTIGPGDRISVTVWGRYEGQWNVAVDRNGMIALPKVGMLPVAGLTYTELTEMLRKEFARYYSGFEMNVTLGALRSFPVYVMGNARKPGSYMVNSMTTLIGALFHVGGPSKTGTMRDVQLKRNGQVVAHVDLYDFLLNGDKSSDVRLEPEDVIFIPSVGPLAAVAGGVQNPAIFELKGEVSIGDLIRMAGGLTETAAQSRILIERIEDNARRSLVEEVFQAAMPKQAMPGDLIKVFRIYSDERLVNVHGAVYHPGAYGIQSGMTVSSLVEIAGGLRPTAFTRSAELTRADLTQDGATITTTVIDLVRAMAHDPEHDVALQQYDSLIIKHIPDLRLNQTVEITGEVLFPGKYTIGRGERISSVIRRAGGFTDQAYLPAAVFTREELRREQQRRITEMVDRLEVQLLGNAPRRTGSSVDPEEVRIHEMERAQQLQFINRLREAKAQGRLILAISPLDKFADSRYDVQLEDGDILHIPTNNMSVRVMGSVYNQATFLFDEGESSYEYYVRMSGGYTPNAAKGMVYIMKANGMAVKPSFWGSTHAKAEIEPGDTIVVPEELEDVGWLRGIKDVTEILYQIAVSAGVLIVAY